jgi:hypothetical protein
MKIYNRLVQPRERSTYVLDEVEEKAKRSSDKVVEMRQRGLELKQVRRLNRSFHNVG